jgi:hypothetical protein
MRIGLQKLAEHCKELESIRQKMAVPAFKPKRITNGVLTATFQRAFLRRRIRSLLTIPQEEKHG